MLCWGGHAQQWRNSARLFQCWATSATFGRVRQNMERTPPNLVDITQYSAKLTTDFGAASTMLCHVLPDLPWSGACYLSDSRFTGNMCVARPQHRGAATPIRPRGKSSLPSGRKFGQFTGPPRCTQVKGVIGNGLSFPSEAIARLLLGLGFAFSDMAAQLLSSELCPSVKT